ncbi:hypothetical protein AB3464_06120 [Pseudomonas asplenii]|uniref:hypothetical protein n=1 Tax=Pseudomonas asplenii TaxID=53407 RepID=UPI0037C6F2C5
MQFTALLHHITPQLLAQSFYALRRDAAVGVDGMSWREYEEGLLQRVTELQGCLVDGHASRSSIGEPAAVAQCLQCQMVELPAHR